MSFTGTVGPVTITRLTRINPGPEGQPRWRVVLSDSTEAVTETGSPVGYTINTPANAGTVMVEFRKDKIASVRPCCGVPSTAAWYAYAIIGADLEGGGTETNELNAYYCAAHKPTRATVGAGLEPGWKIIHFSVCRAGAARRVLRKGNPSRG